MAKKKENTDNKEVLGENKENSAAKTADAGAENGVASAQEKFQIKLRELLALAKKKKNMLEYQEISDFFSDMQLDAEQFADTGNIGVISHLNEWKMCFVAKCRKSRRESLFARIDDNDNATRILLHDTADQRS